MGPVSPLTGLTIVLPNAGFWAIVALLLFGIGLFSWNVYLVVLTPLYDRWRKMGRLKQFWLYTFAVVGGVLLVAVNTLFFSGRITEPEAVLFGADIGASIVGLTLWLVSLQIQAAKDANVELGRIVEILNERLPPPPKAPKEPPPEAPDDD